jgi:DNA helicase-2/ATP-dependent DNA helicase PcrA
MDNQGKQSFSFFFNEYLNPAQQKAVKHKSGPLLVVAGAGSGKTRVITARITNLILNEGVNPTSMIALTFTNKAAAEMKERITRFLDKKSPLPFIGTFHAYCLQILKSNPKLLKYSPFSILDSDDQLKLLGKIITRHNLGKKITARQLSYHISKLKNGGWVDHNQQEQYGSNIDPLVRQVFHTYEAEKVQSQCFDFDDLLLEVLALFKTNQDFKTAFQERIRHLLIDEYQDTNIVQHELLKHMALTSKKQFTIDSLCAVGDEDQSIYSWRGATVTNILNFTKDFPHAALITIDQNYRSVQPILEAANHVIKHNEQRNPKTLWSQKKGSDRIRGLSCMSGYQEADVIANCLQLIARTSSLRMVAILYRAHYQSRTLEEALIKNSIAYRIIGGIQFYERAEIKDLLAYLRLIVNPFDRISLFRVINTPARGLGEKFEELLYERWNSEPLLSFQQICTKILDEKILPKSKHEALSEFLTIFNDLTPTSTPSSALASIIYAAQYLAYLKETHDADEAQSKTENVKELIQAINHFEEQGLTTIEAFLNEVALMQEKTTGKESDDHVQLMTLHAAKGLEFETVIITGLEDGLLPSGHAQDRDDGLEEERRLLYVGITRACERLLITYARYRHTFGHMETQLPSPFLREIPQSLLTIEDCAHWSVQQIQTFFAQWLNIKQQLEMPTFNTTRRASLKHQEPVPSAAASTTVPWKKHQTVKHATFGLGIIQQVEKKNDTTTYITAHFKVGIKKIDARFLETKPL